MTSRALVKLILTFVLFFTFDGIANGQSIGAKMVTFLDKRIDHKLGGGECAHLASEALRVAGGEFIRSDIAPDFPTSPPGNYVWGTLVTVIEFKNGKIVDSNLSSKVSPGDIIQYRNVKLSNGKSYPHHTSVVCSVNTKARPSKVYEQNISGVRKCMKNSIDLTKMTAGWVRIYRPKARSGGSTVKKFTIVNFKDFSETVKIKVGSRTTSLVLTKYDTTDCFKSYKQTTSSKAYLVSSDGHSVEITSGVGYYAYKWQGKMKIGWYSTGY